VAATLAAKIGKNRGRIPTGGEIFGDGRMVEIVRDPSGPANLALLFWNRKQAAFLHQVKIRSKCYVPLQVDQRIIRQLRLPERVLPYGSTTELFNVICGVVSVASSLASDQVALLAYFALSSWFPECLNTSPCLLLRGSSSADAIALLRILGWVCRHSMLLADARAAVPPELKPTRLICQADRHFDKLLAGFRARGFATSRNGLFDEMAGATAIYLPDRELQSNLADTCLSVSVSPGGRLLSSSDEQRLLSSVDDLQAKLLSYRIANFEKVNTSEFDAPEFAGSTREIARSLGSSLIGAPDLQKQLVDLLSPVDAAAKVESVTRLEPIVVEALLASCHEGRETVHVGQIAELVNCILTRQSEALALKPREIGSWLKRLGFRTTRLDSAGRGVYLLSAERKRVHDLALSLRVPSIVRGEFECPLCLAARERL
jgi:hypothetical protein